MNTLIGKILCIFAFSGKKVLFIVLGVLVFSLGFFPGMYNSISRDIAIRGRLDMLVKLNAMDRTKIKEPILKDGYTALLKDFAEKRDVAIGVEKGLAPPKTIKEIFSMERRGIFISGALLWVLLGLISLFSKGNGVLEKIITFFGMLALALVSGYCAEFLPTITPSLLHFLTAPFVEMVIFSIAGTLIMELNRK